MQINELQLKNKRKTKKTIGRGGKKGTYSGRGMKGQKARSGASINPLFEGGRSTLVDHLKKKRGFKSPHPKKININLSDLENDFKTGDVVSVDSLIEKGLISKKEIKNTKIKILGNGKLTKKISIDKEILMSKSAQEAIKKANQ